MLTLYQFPISHFCENARWTLEYKQLEYKKVTLLPGLHFKKAKKLASKSSLPILMHGKKVINESSEIISYLDQTFPQNILTPQEFSLKKQTSEWEQFADKELGPDVRCLCYHTLLDHPDITIPFFTLGGPWYGKLVMKKIYPNLCVKMREFMKINDKTAAHANKRLAQAIDKVYAHIKDREFFVGDSFTRADVAVAALLAPLCRPKKYGLDWPKQYPDPLHSAIDKYADKLNWVTRMYEQYR